VSASVERLDVDQRLDGGRDTTLPPHDADAERAVLGSVLKNPLAIFEVTDALEAAAFYDVRHRLIYAAMLGLVASDVPIDYATLAAELEREGSYDRAGGLVYLSEINLATPSSAHIGHYARIVSDHALRRRAISVAQGLVEVAWRAAEPTDELLARSQAAVLGLSEHGAARSATTTAAEAIGRWMAGFEAPRGQNDRGDRVVGCTTGLRCLDRITLGLQPARLYLLSAYTSVGKSQVAHQVALHVARNHGPVLMASLEMGDTELTARAIAHESGVPAEALATHELSEREAAAVLAAAERQSSDPLYYMDGSDGLTTSQIRSRALGLQAQLGKLALIVVDYGQLLQDSKGNNSTVEDQTLVSRNLKRLARALDVPLLVPVQINRQAGGRGDQRPRLSDIRESGSWEQDSDVVIGLYRDELVHPDTDQRGMLELSVLKNRHAGQKPPAIFKAVWHGARYWEWDGNSYAERARIPRAVERAFETPAEAEQGRSRLPYRDNDA
jgi:replicative DNA helicase